MKISNKTYDLIKWIALIVLPACNVLILTVGKIWGLPYYAEIGATVAAFGVFLAAIIKTSSDNYSEGEVVEDHYLEDGDDDEQ